MNVLLTPPTLEDTAQTRRPPAPTLWEAGPAPVTQVGKNGTLPYRQTHQNEDFRLLNTT